MIPRFPPVLLALIGGGAIYGIKYALDKFEPKALGPPGSGDHYERVIKYRQNVKRLGIAGAVSGVIFAGYLVYDARQHRASPASVKHDNQDFYNDQYTSRDNTFKMDKLELDKKRREKESLAQQQLEREVESMENLITKNK